MKTFQLDLMKTVEAIWKKMKKDGRRMMDGQTLKLWLKRNMMDLYRTPENTDSSQRLYFFYITEWTYEV